MVRGATNGGMDSYRPQRQSLAGGLSKEGEEVQEAGRGRGRVDVRDAFSSHIFTYILFTYVRHVKQKAL